MLVYGPVLPGKAADMTDDEAERIEIERYGSATVMDSHETCCRVTGRCSAS